MASDIRCVELGKLSVPGMRIKVRWFPEGVYDEQEWRVPANVLSFSRVVGEPVLHRRSDGVAPHFHPAGPLTFWPRSAVCASRRNGSQVLAVSTYFESLGVDTLDLPPAGMPIEDFSMLELMQLLHDEVRSPGPSSRELVVAVGDILRIKLSRLLSQRVRNPSVAKPCRNVDVAMIHGLIGNATGRFPTTSQLSEQLSTSRRSLHRLFRATTGAAPSRYIEQMKIESAKTLLATSKMTMKQVAHAAGYSTASHFSSRFRQWTGLTPSAFRRKALRAEGGHATVCTSTSTAS